METKIDDVMNVIDRCCEDLRNVIYDNDWDDVINYMIEVYPECKYIVLRAYYGDDLK